MAGSIGGTPAAVLVGSVIIACGLYFGLRARAPAVMPTSAGGGPPEASAALSTGSPVIPGAASSAQPPSSTAAAALLAQVAGATPAGPVEVDRDVLAALESQRATLVSACWKPATAGQSKPASATYDFDLSFDEAGHEVGRGLTGRGGASTELTQCLYRKSPELVIPARGGRVHSRVRFTLP
jgi:hypothetical protein